MIDINNGKLILVPASGKLVPVDSVNASGWEATTTAAFNRGLVKTRTITDVNYFYSDNPSQMPVACRTGTANASTINWNTTLARNVNMDANVYASNLNTAYTNGTLPITVRFVFPYAAGKPGNMYAFYASTKEFLLQLKTAAVPNKSNATMEAVDPSGQLTNPPLGYYSTNAGNVNSGYGLNLSELEVGPGSNGIHRMLRASDSIVGSGYNIVKANNNNVTLTIKGITPTSHPQLFDGNNIVVYIDSLKPLAKLLGITGTMSARMEPSPYYFTIQIPVGRAEWSYINMGGSAGEAQILNIVKIKPDTNNRFTSTATSWFRFSR